MSWAVQDAKARFSKFLETTLASGPQVVTKRGVEMAVLVPIEDWKRLKAGEKKSLKDLLLQSGPYLELPPRRKTTYRHRPPIDL